MNPASWPYIVPYAGFLVLVQVQGWVPTELAPYMLFAKVAVPAALLIFFAARGAYEELRQYRLGTGTLLDVGVGLAIAALWVGPFLLFPSLPRGEGFDPNGLGEGLQPVALGLRLTGFALVTPFVEELFVRSFLIREVDAVAEGRSDFREIPMARFGWLSFALTTLWFTFSHVSWEWVVAAPTGALFTLWLYARRDLGATVVAHAVANGAIWAMVVFGPAELWAFL